MPLTIVHTIGRAFAHVLVVGVSSSRKLTHDDADTLILELLERHHGAIVKTVDVRTGGRFA